MSSPFETVDYDPRHQAELVSMWRASFEEAVGIVDPHPLEEQARYFETEVRPRNRVLVVLEKPAGDVVAFMAYSVGSIAQLYVRLDRQRRGIGTDLLRRAQSDSGGRLTLFTFDANEKAKRFYERHGFRVLRRGLEPEWGLPDVEYEWRASF